MLMLRSRNCQGVWVFDASEEAVVFFPVVLALLATLGSVTAFSVVFAGLSV
jgi:hypothetical protein